MAAVGLLQCPVCNKDFDPSADGAQRNFNFHVNRCVDGLWSQDSSRSSSQQAVGSGAPPEVSSNATPVVAEPAPGRTHDDTARQLSGRDSGVAAVPATAPAPQRQQELVAMLISIMPDLTPVQAHELLVGYDYQLEILVPMLLELQEEPAAPSRRQYQQSASTQQRRPLDDPPAPQQQQQQQQQSQKQPEPLTSLVELVVYDLQPDRSFAKTVGLGAFHSAVIVHGVEISFGGTLDRKANTDLPGVWYTHRKYAAAPAVKCRLLLGETRVSRPQLRELLDLLGTAEWRLKDYHLLAKNCNNFTDMFLRRIGPQSSKLADPAQFATLQARDVQATGSKRDGLGQPLPRLELPDDYFDAKKDPFKLPGWVNRAAKLGDTFVPDFIYAKILEKLMPPVAEDQHDDTPPHTPVAAAVAAAPAASAVSLAPSQAGRPLPPQIRPLPAALAVTGASLSYTQRAAAATNKGQQVPPPPAGRPPSAAAAETSAEAAAVASIGDVVGLDSNDPSVRARILATLRSCNGNADVAVGRLL